VHVEVEWSPYDQRSKDSTECEKLTLGLRLLLLDDEELGVPGP